MKNVLKLGFAALLVVFFGNCGGGDNGGSDNGNTGGIGGGNNAPQWSAETIPPSPDGAQDLYSKGLDIDGKLVYAPFNGSYIMSYDYNNNVTTFEKLENISVADISYVNATGVFSAQQALGSSYDPNYNWSECFGGGYEKALLDNDGNGVYVGEADYCPSQYGGMGTPIKAMVLLSDGSKKFYMLDVERYVYGVGAFVLHSDGKFYHGGLGFNSNHDQGFAIYSFDPSNNFAPSKTFILTDIGIYMSAGSLGGMSADGWIYWSGGGLFYSNMRYNPSTSVFEKVYPPMTPTIGIGQATLDFDGDVVFSTAFSAGGYGANIVKYINGTTPVLVPVNGLSDNEFSGVASGSYDGVSIITAPDGKIYTLVNGGTMLIIGKNSADVRNFPEYSNNDVGDSGYSGCSGTLTQSGKIIWQVSHNNGTRQFLILNVGAIDASSPLIKPSAGNIAASKYNSMVNHF